MSKIGDEENKLLGESPGKLGSRKIGVTKESELVQISEEGRNSLSINRVRGDTIKDPFLPTHDVIKLVSQIIDPSFLAAVILSLRFRMLV